MGTSVACPRNHRQSTPENTYSRKTTRTPIARPPMSSMRYESRRSGFFSRRGLFHLIVGDLAHSLMLLAFATLNIALVAVQESRNERALTTLRDLENPQPHHSGRSTSAYR